MFCGNWFKKQTIGEPVLTLVEKVKENPKKHDLKLLGRDHLMFYFEGNVDYAISISCSPGWLHVNDQAKWMSKAEQRYIHKELIPLAKGDQYSRAGWMQKVFPKENR